MQLPPPAAVPRVHQPGDGTAGGELRGRPDGARLRRPRDDRRHAPRVQRRTSRREPEAMVSPGMVNDEFVALCPTFLMDDRDEAFRGRSHALRFFAEAITHWAAPQRCGPHTRHRARRQRGVHGRAPADGASDAIAHGEAPPTAASSMYNTDHTLGDADARDRLRGAAPRHGRRQRHVPDPDGHARAGRDDGVDPHLRRAGDPALPRPRRHRRRREGLTRQPG